LALFKAAGLIALSVLVFSPTPSLASYEIMVQDPYGGGGQEDPGGFIPFDDFTLPANKRKAKTVRKKAGATDKSTATGKGKSTAKAKDGAGPDSGKLRFSQDIAPILVANCTTCHSGNGNGLKRGKLDLSTFENLEKGAKDHKVVVPGKPDESTLVQRIKGEIEPRMPMGGQNTALSDAAISSIERWIKEGAKLDAGKDRKKPIASYAASGEQMRRAEVAKLPVGTRDQKIESVGFERWKQANPKLKPEVVRDSHFMMFSTLPRDRAASTLKVLETQYGLLRRMVGAEITDRPEKISVYVFPTRKDFIEFVRTVENRADVDPEESVSGRLGVPQPYLAVVDPQGGTNAESGTPKRSRARGRRGGEEKAGESVAERSLQGLLVEALGVSVMASAGNPPRWLAFGIGGYLASLAEPRSPYYRQLRQAAFANWQQGWPTRTNETLGGSNQVTPDALRAISFALVESMMSTSMRQRFPEFVGGMLQGGEKLDDMFQMVYGGTREEFINGTGEWVAHQYGQLQ
jgi:hypothetical protein